MVNKKTLNSKYFSPLDLEIQENLSEEKLKSFNTNYQIDFDSPRPESSFIDLMEWTKNNFIFALKDQDNINKFVHNRIIIDGQFMQYCEENNIAVECLYKDSILSWRTENFYEKYFVQGVFLIKTNNVEFIHAALFHKGNQNEDEISFFNLVSDKNYYNYLLLRNSFDSWVQQRDRSNLHVRVIDGDDIPYTKDNAWDDLFLPENIKLEIKNLVEGFLASKDFYSENKMPWKRGVLLYGKPGCHAKGTPIMMSDGSWKNAEDVELGDYLMGPDSEPREVLKLVRGKENMYQINPVKGKSFTVNENHILHLQHSGTSTGCPSVCNITLKEYLRLSKSLKEKLKLVKSPTLLFYPDKFESSENYEIDPYILGVWLGDGTSGKPEFTSADPEIIDYIECFASKNNLYVNKRKNKGKAFTLSLSAKDGYKNIFTQQLRKLGIFDNKSIPQKYLTADVNTRLQLLAGIIDTDGSYNSLSWRASEKYNKKTLSNKGCFDFIQKDLELSQQIQFLCYSLGFGCTFKKCVKTIKSNNFSGEYYRMSIYGDIFNIPTKLPRKQARRGNQNKNCRMIGVKSVEPVGVDDFYGFTVDKDHLYVMDDFWITHNCGKSSIIKTIMSEYNFKPVTILPGADDHSIRDAFAYAEEQSPSLLYFEDLDSILEKNDISSFLNLMDGIAAKNGLLVVATANEIKKLKPSITDRPSRFDRKFEIPLPNQNMSLSYLKKWFGNLITLKKCKELAKCAEKHEFSYAYLKDIYISSMFEALSNNRKTPTEKDIDTSLNRLIKEKSINNKSINMDKYFK
jgi:hypothetical protein